MSSYFLPAPAPKKPRSEIAGLVLLGVGLLILLGLVVGAAFFFTMITDNRAIDEATGCLKDDPPPQHVVVLVDQSDPFSKAELATASARIKHEGLQLVRFGKLTILNISPATPRQPATVFVACSPGQIEGVSFWAQLTSNLRIRRQEWEAKLGDPLDKKLEPLLAEQTAITSPIIESLLEAIKNSDFRETKGEKTLIIFSDMLQNTKVADGGWSMFGNKKPSWESFEESRLGKRRRTHLDKFRAVAHWMERPDHSDMQQSADVQDFWEMFFDDLGGTYTAEGIVS